MFYAKYSKNDKEEILKDGHTMFPADIVKDLNRKSYLEQNVCEAEKQLVELREVIQKYALHLPTCEIVGWNFPKGPCTCGLLEALK